MKLSFNAICVGLIYLVLAALVLLISLGNFSGLFEALFNDAHIYCSRNNAAESLIIGNFLVAPLYILMLALILFIRNRVNKNSSGYSFFSDATKTGNYFNKLKLVISFIYPISLLFGLLIPCVLVTY